MQDWEKDTEYQEYIVKEIRPEDSTHFEIKTDAGWCLCVHNKKRLALPKAGDKVRFYSRGVGHTIRGFACDDRVYYYKTAAEHEKCQKKESADTQKKDKAKFKKDFKKWSAQVKELPEAFRKRIQFFMGQNPDWGWTYGDYELFTCQEAVKLAKYLHMSEASLKAFRDLKHDQQMIKAKEAGMDVSNHSGNTYGMAVTLAFIYITKPDHVAKMHGALCPLVGCKDYGCWSTTEEAHKEPPCSACEGTGKSYSHSHDLDCPTCHGTGITPKEA